AVSGPGRGGPRLLGAARLRRQCRASSGAGSHADACAPSIVPRSPGGSRQLDEQCEQSFRPLKQSGFVFVLTIPTSPTMKLIKMVSPALLTLGLFLTGCASSGVKNPSGVPVTEMKADERGFVAGTGVESQDLVAVTDKMARSILYVKPIANAQGTPRIVLDPVINETRFPINKDIVLTSIRTQLNSKAQGKVLFVARERMAVLEKERELKQSRKVTSS